VGALLDYAEPGEATARHGYIPPVFHSFTKPEQSEKSAKSEIIKSLISR